MASAWTSPESTQRICWGKRNAARASNDIKASKPMLSGSSHLRFRLVGAWLLILTSVAELWDQVYSPQSTVHSPRSRSAGDCGFWAVGLAKTKGEGDLWHAEVVEHNCVTKCLVLRTR